MKKPVTNEDLAKMLMSMSSRQDSMDAKLSSMNTTLVASKQDIEHLAEMTANQFSIQNERIDSMEQRMIEGFTGVGEDIANIRYYLFNLDERFVSHSKFEDFITKNKLAH